MSQTKKVETARCRNEACPRPAETGEPYCEGCGLERSLYMRDGGRERDRVRAIRARAEAGR